MTREITISRLEAASARAAVRGKQDPKTAVFYLYKASALQNVSGIYQKMMGHTDGIFTYEEKLQRVIDLISLPQYQGNHQRGAHDGYRKALTILKDELENGIP